MKKLLLLLTLIPFLTFSQSPDLMSYQTVVWDTGNNLVVNSPVGFQMSILQGTITGPAVYVETHNVNTNNNGLASFEIGAGTVVSGDISTIDWSNGPYFLMSETDPNGGTNYTISGTSQLLSVPYALYANVADSVVNDMVDDADPDPNNEIQTISQTGNVITLSNGGGSVVASSLDDDPTNELQDLSFSNDTVYISDGAETYVGPEDVIYPTLMAPTVNYGVGYRDASFYKDKDRVYLQGLLNNCSTGQLLFVLPVGYRPTSTVILSTSLSNVYARIDITPNGNVTYTIGPAGPGHLNLDGLSFRISE